MALEVGALKGGYGWGEERWVLVRLGLLMRMSINVFVLTLLHIQVTYVML